MFLIENNFSLEKIEFWEYLEELRNLKNEVFFTSISEKTASLLELQQHLKSRVELMLFVTWKTLHRLKQPVR